MALRDITPAQKAVYGVFRLWIEQALKSDGSIFTPGRQIWSAANLDELNRDFVEKPDVTKDSFIHKLEKQLKDSSDGAVQLCAEMLFLNLLITVRVKATSKLEAVQQVLNLMSEPVDVPENLVSALDGGLCSPGPAFNSRRPIYLFQQISFMRAWKALSSAEQESLLRDPWSFKALVYKDAVTGANAQRHALCHYAHPEHFEIIVSRKHKKLIVEGFKHLLTKRYDDVDQAIYAIRQALQKGRDERIDFYGEEFHGQWWIDPSPTNDRRFWWVNQGKTYAAERDGGYIWAPQRTKSGASPYYFWENVNRVSPGDIIFHYEDGAIRAVSIATEPGRDAERPPELPPVEWDVSGWRADCDYVELAEPIPLVEVQSRLAEMELDRGPVNDTGRVNQGYLYGIPAEAVAILADHLNPSELPDEMAQALGIKPSGKTMERRDDLNVIYYGPPGTGKTYITAQRALEIIDGSAPAGRNAVMKRFRELRESEQVAFVTFHQSYSYEEFVEGIRPVLTDEEKESDSETSETSAVRYECKSGVFRRICERAELVGPKPAPTFELDLEKTKVWKMSLGATWDAQEEWVYDEAIEENWVLLGWGGAIDFSGCDTQDAVAERFRSRQEGDPAKEFAIRAVDRFKNRISVGDLLVVSDGNLKFRAIGRVTGDYFHIDREDYSQARPVEWLLVLDESRSSDIIMKKVFSQATIYELKPKVLKLEGLRSVLSPEQPSKPRRYVLIIDEINRGNIAKVLGELITLLEPDKRLGAANELRAILPYSGTEFGVPSNLYVIGTMNTADRSIAFLDTALRRRFRFLEMMPNSAVVRSLVGKGGVIDGVDVAQLLETINERIELLYDRDHTLGHAYLLNVKTLDDLRRVFLDRLIPLLQEYFYDDWSKIGLVLGCPFDEGRTRNTRPILTVHELDAEGILGDVDDYETKLRFQVNPDFEAADATNLSQFFNALAGTQSS